MPGLIDSHCHSTFDEVSSNDELFFHRSRPGLAAVIAAENLKRILRAGVTSICDPDSIHELGYDLKEAINAGVFPGPRMRTGGYALLTSVGGTAGRLIPDQGIVGYGKVVKGKDEIVAEVRRQIKMGADWIKVHVSGLIPNHRQRGELCVWSREELEIVCQTSHDLGTPVMGHCRGSSSVFEAARAGFDLILHGTLMEAAALDMMKRLGVMDDAKFETGAFPEYGDTPTYSLPDDKWQMMEDELYGKRAARKSKADKERLDIDNLMDRAREWAQTVAADYMADNREFEGGLEDIAWDMSDAAEMEFKEDEWNELLYHFDFNVDDLRMFIADEIAGYGDAIEG